MNTSLSLPTMLCQLPDALLKLFQEVFLFIHILRSCKTESCGNEIITVYNIIKCLLNSLRISDAPSPPVLVAIKNIGPHSATISWSEGFHGGSDQTVYYEISTDNTYTTWTPVRMHTIGTSETISIRKTTVNNLMEETIYFIRLYSTNSLGRSEMTDLSTFTTTCIALLQFVFYIV